MAPAQKEPVAILGEAPLVLVRYLGTGARTQIGPMTKTVYRCRAGQQFYVDTRDYEGFAGALTQDGEAAFERV